MQELLGEEKDTYVGRVLAGRYTLLAPIGKGGAGNVYLGLQLQLERKVAIKLVRTDLPARERAEFEIRFRREASLAGRLQHPNIVTVHDYGITDDGIQYVVM